MKEDDAIIYVRSGKIPLAFKSDTNKVQTYGNLVPDAARYTPPEVAKGGWEVIKHHPLAAVDAYGLGVLTIEVFNGQFVGTEQIGKTTNIPPSMQQSYKRLCAANPKLRLSPAHFVEQGKKRGGFFQTPLIRLTEDMESLGLKSDAERESFIKYVISQLSSDIGNSCSTSTVNLMGCLMIFPKISSK